MADTKKMADIKWSVKADVAQEEGGQAYIVLRMRTEAPGYSTLLCIKEEEAIELMRTLAASVARLRYSSNNCECAPLIVDLISADCAKHDPTNQSSPPTASHTAALEFISDDEERRRAIMDIIDRMTKYTAKVNQEDKSN